MKYSYLIFGIILLLSINIVHSVLTIEPGVIFDPDNSDTNFTFANQYNVTTLSVNESHIEINDHMLKVEPVTGEANCTIYEFKTSTDTKYRAFNMTATNITDKIDFVVGGYTSGDLVGIVINTTTGYPTRTIANATGFIEFTHTGYSSSTNFTFMILENETYSDEIFDGNVYADEYEPVNVTLTLDSGFSASVVTSYTIPYNIADVNISTIQIIDKDNTNTSFTRSGNTITFTAFGTLDTYTIQYDVYGIKKMTVTEYGNCPTGYTNHTNYCQRLLASSVKDVHDYRYYINVSRNETNSSHILHNQSTTVFTRFNDRVNFSVTLNTSATNTTNTVTGTTLNFNVSDTYQTTYSLNEGIYYIHINYYVIPTPSPPSGGTSSGDGAPAAVCGNGICESTENSTTCPVDCPLGLVSDFTVPTSINLSLVSGITNKNEIMVRNLGNHTIQLMVDTVCMEGYEEMCNWNWFLVDDKRSSNKLLELEPFENDTITLYTLPPLSVTQVTYYIHLKFSRVDDNIDDSSPLVKYTRVDETIMLASGLELATQYAIDTWNHELYGDFANPIPVLNKNDITAGDLVIIFFITSGIILIAYKYMK